jgi:uncharacterized repeat protein (TIGR03803 family)
MIQEKHLSGFIVGVLSSIFMVGTVGNSFGALAFSILHGFTGASNDGGHPYDSLTLSGSVLYGMTSGGGNGPDYSGTIFVINTDGTDFRLLHSFQSQIGHPPDGAAPLGSLTLSGSTLYGMTSFGGSDGVFNDGEIFRINTDGSGYQVLKNFSGSSSDGRDPGGSLTLSGATLYGMTPYGGVGDNGTIFSINTDGTGYRILHFFTGGSDGYQPWGSLALSGNKLYGMASHGGGGYDSGTIFCIDTDGTGYQILYRFNLPGTVDDGANPTGSLTVSGTTLYGMTPGGGNGQNGTIFCINTDGTGYEVLYRFTNGSDGYSPHGSLILSRPTLYGMASHGGGDNVLGTIFQINTDGSSFQLLHSFVGGTADGAYPLGSLTLSVTGLYGMAQYEGPGGDGVIFTLSIPPSAATLVSPSGNISTATPTYTWDAVASATWYYLWVKDSSTSAKIQQWYTAAQCGCGSGTGQCSVTPTVTLSLGAAQWWVQTWNSAGYGPWSTGMAFTVSASLPPAATLISPSGSITTSTPAYTWNAVLGSTWYYLWVNDASASPKIQQWYTAAQAGCASGTGTCSVTPSVTLASGAAQWWIQTWNPSGYGPWSTGMSFTVSGNLPGAATLVSPSGTISTRSPTYIWNAVPNATWYYLWVNDGTGTKIATWYTAALAGCASGTGTCSVTPSVTLASGAAQWWIQTWNPSGYGPWSTGMGFIVP